MLYVDGFVLTVPKKNLKAYTALSKKAGKVWRKHGALSYYEAVGEDMKTGMGVPFPKLAKAKPGEVVVFSWITYKSRKHRDQVLAKVMKEPSLMPCEGEKMPFDVKRMSYGGFQVFVDE